MLLSDLTRMKVISADGEEVGEVQDIQLDVSEWKVIGLVIKPVKRLAKEFDLKSAFKIAPISLETKLIKSVKDVIVLSASSGGLRRILKRQITLNQR